ncbi:MULTISPECIES: daptide-type RiPP biosynthesis aminotransferase [Streptomyces]|uniref:Daptide-type RiPP biosynthesis aminotransferase n=1 Tax=Streptomyces marokkonensis TaxID=324855 RepID=A0ABW6QJM7_9ACTN|nr:daptide-type RiPP biosynthesis aminotransferase [Streptomyces marokkonensis]
MIEQSAADHPVWDLLLPPSEHGTPERHVVRAHGHRLTFADGADVLDATCGLWNANLGYGNEVIARAVAEATAEASYMGTFRRSHDYARDAARALIEAAGADRYARVLFSTSGSSANDVAMKISRQYASLRGEDDRKLVVGLHGSYHGQTYGGFALSGEDFQKPMYGADTSLIRHVGHDDPQELTALMRACGSRVAAVVVEPVLGSGSLALGTDMIKALVTLRHEYGFLLVCDEVAAGFGRTGTLFASELWPESPDLLLTSKGLTNGTCAASAVLAAHRVWEEFARHDATLIHGETQAGTPASCAAILATLQQIEELDALNTARRNGRLMAEGLAGIVARSELAAEATGTGCFQALHLRTHTGAPFWQPHVMQMIDAVRARGVLVYPGPSSLQVFPALTWSEEEVATCLRALEDGLGDFAAAREARAAARAATRTA